MESVCLTLIFVLSMGYSIVFILVLAGAAQGVMDAELFRFLMLWPLALIRWLPVWVYTLVKWAGTGWGQSIIDIIKGRVP